MHEKGEERMPRRPRKSRSPEEQEEIERNVDAFLQSEMMEDTAAYLSRGRPYSTISPEEANRRWTAAVVAWFEERHPGRQREMDDLAAELRLRGLAPPYDAVRSTFDAMRAEIARDGPDNPGVRERIRKFMEARDKPDG